MPSGADIERRGATAGTGALMALTIPLDPRTQKAGAPKGTRHNDHAEQLPEKKRED
jgi:hypothetical protein